MILDPHSNKNRNFRVVSDTVSKVLICSKASYMMVKRVQMMDKDRQSQALLKKIPIIREWSLMKIINMCYEIEKHTYEPGSIVYDIGSPTDKIYFI